MYLLPESLELQVCLHAAICPLLFSLLGVIKDLLVTLSGRLLRRRKCQRRDSLRRTDRRYMPLLFLKCGKDVHVEFFYSF